MASAIADFGLEKNGIKRIHLHSRFHERAVTIWAVNSDFNFVAHGFLLSLGRRGGKYRIGNLNLQRSRAGEVRSEPLNKTRFRFRSFAIEAIPLLLGNIPKSEAKNQMKLDRGRNLYHKVTPFCD